jgi:hypothetical protein
MMTRAREVLVMATMMTARAREVLILVSGAIM